MKFFFPLVKIFKLSQLKFDSPSKYSFFNIYMGNLFSFKFSNLKHDLKKIIQIRFFILLDFFQNSYFILNNSFNLFNLLKNVKH